MTSLALLPVSEPITRRDLEVMVGAWQSRLRLDHWTITVDWSEPMLAGEVTLADSLTHGAYDYARIRFAAEFATWTRRDANLVVVHELMHLISRDLEYAAEAGEQAMAKAARGLFKARINHEIEALVDKAATVMVDLGGIV